MRRHIFLLLCFVLWSLFGVAAAQGSLRITENSYKSRFGQGVDFRLIAESDVVIQRVSLYRQLVGERVKVRAQPDFEPGKWVDVQYTWELEPGDLAPGAQVSYFWELTDAAGHQVRTDPLVFSYDDDRFDWKLLSQGEIIAHYYGGKDKLAAEILSVAQEAAQRLQQDIGIALQKPVHIYIYNSRDDMRGALSPRGGVYDARTVTLGVAEGGDTLLLLGTHPDIRNTIAHEMSHIIVNLATDNPYTELPRWLSEGLAMYAEGELLPDNAKALERAIREDRLISIRSLSSYVGDPAQVDLFYGEAYSLIAFMLKSYGSDKLMQLLTTLRSGIPTDEAVRQVYGFGLDQLDDEWRASLGLGPRAQMQATPTPPESGKRGSPFCVSPLAAAWLVIAGLAMLFQRR